MREKVLIVRLGALGDTLVCLPCIMALKERYEVHFLGRSPAILYLKPYISNTYDVESQEWNGLFCEIPKIQRDQIDHFDTIVAFISTYRDLFEKNLAKVFRNSKIHIFPSLPASDQRQIHIIKYILASLQESGLDIKPDHVRSIIRKGLFKYNGDAPIVLYHLGSGSPKKNLDLYIWLKIKQLLGTMFPDKKHLFVIGPDETETKEKIRLMFPSEELFYSHSLEQLTDLLQKTYLYLGHDSGPTHYSALLGIPTLALFKWSSVKIWRPVGRAVKVLKLLPRIDPLKAIPKTVSKFFQG